MPEPEILRAQRCLVKFLLGTLLSYGAGQCMRNALSTATPNGEIVSKPKPLQASNQRLQCPTVGAFMIRIGPRVLGSFIVELPKE